MAAITDLATLAITDVADDDWLVVHDLSVGTDKKMAVASALGPSGTFTPVLAFNGVQTGITYSTNTGRYFRIGNYVWVTAQITLTSKGSASGSAAIFSLPYAYSGIPSTFSVFWSGLATSIVYAVGLSASSSSIALYYASAAATGVSAMTDAIIGNSTTLYISGGYRTSDAK